MPENMLNSVYTMVCNQLVDSIIFQTQLIILISSVRNLELNFFDQSVINLITRNIYVSLYKHFSNHYKHSK